MKNKAFIILTLVCVLFVSNKNFAQISNIGPMLSGSVDDAEKILQAYFKPYANAFGANLNGAWYNTAKTHKLAGFDLTLSISTSIVPNSDREFDASQLGLSAGAVVDPNQKMSPTAAGKRTTGAKINYPEFGANFGYNLPKGTGWRLMPSPMIQLGVGLVKETDLTFRYVPSLTIGDFGKLGLWGVGIKHSLKQWIPGIKALPFFHLSLFMGYTQLKTNANISFQPSFYNDYIEPNPSDEGFDNQKMEMKINGFTSSLLASFDLPVVTFYGGAGFSTTSANIKLTGDYPIPTGNPMSISTITNPIDLKIKNSSGAKPRLTAGIKFKMAVITYHIDYTYAKYSVITTGLGLSFR